MDITESPPHNALVTPIRSRAGSRLDSRSIRSQSLSESKLARSVSPKKLPPGVDENNPVYKMAMAKLIEASMKFDREAAGQLLLKALENRELEKKYFQHTLKTKMDCRLTTEELDTLMPFIQNKEYPELVNGCEFILLFYKLRFDGRAHFLTERIEREKKLLESAQIRADRRKTELFKKCNVSIDYNGTQQDLDNAIRKLQEAAFLYDRLMPGSVQLDGFECESMPLDIFKDQLRRVFNLQYTQAEFGALVKWLGTIQVELERPGSPSPGSHEVRTYTEDRILCASFLVKFFRMGFKERTDRLNAKMAEKKAQAAEREAKRKADLAELERKNALKCSMDFTKDDQERAVRKLREAAKLYDKTTPAATSMKSFEVAFMQPHIFKEQLKRVLNLNLTPKELGGLMRVYDENGDGTVSCEEFEKTFLAMGFEERAALRTESRMRQKRADEARKVAEERQKQALSLKNALKCTFDYTEKEYTSAMHKLIEAAWKFDKMMPGAPCLDAFMGEKMEAHEFKEQFKQAFGVQTTPAELGAILTYFHCNELGQIRCHEFLGRFTLMGVTERAKRLQKWREHQAELNEQRQVVSEAKLAKLEAKNLIELESYTEADFQSALSKLTTAAMKISRHEMGSASLEAFEPVTIPPHTFREQLKMVFNMKTTNAELSALMAYFDKEGKGEINCRDFLIQFFRTGLEERYRLRVAWRLEQQKKKEKDAKALAENEEKKYLRALKEVDYDFSEPEFDTALRKLVLMCHQFDYRQLGPAGWKAFQGATLTPSEFRETLKRTFNVKVTPQELGALVTYFDAQLKGSVNCSVFLNVFVQLRVKCEEFKGRPNETELLDTYHSELKEQYRQRIHKQVAAAGQPPVKPWRIVVKKKEVAKVRNPYPGTAMQKLRLRLVTAKKSLKLDLSSKCCLSESDKAKRQELDLLHQQQKEKALALAALSRPVTSNGAQGEGEGEVGGPTVFLTESGEGGTSSEGGNNPLEPDQQQQQATTATAEPTVSADGRDEDRALMDEALKAQAQAETEAGIRRLDEEEKAKAQAEAQAQAQAAQGAAVPPSADATADEKAPSKTAVAAVVEALSTSANNTTDNNNTSSSSSSSSSNANAKGQGQGNGRKRLPPISIDDMMAIRGGRDLLELNPVELLDCLRCTGDSNTGTSSSSVNIKHELLSNQIATPSLDFMLYTVPDAAFKIQGLTELWLTNNCLTSLPAAVGDLAQLTTLCVAGNRLTSLPQEVTKLVSLRNLYAQRNALTALPEPLTPLQSSLQHLNVSFNSLGPALPESLCELTSLQTLDISCNLLTGLPSNFIRLKNLHVLHMGGQGDGQGGPGMKLAPPCLLRMKWMEITGCPSVSATSDPVETHAHTLGASKGDTVDDLEMFLRSRASSRITAKLRRRKRSKDPKQQVAAAGAGAGAGSGAKSGGKKAPTAAAATAGQQQ